MPNLFFRGLLRKLDESDEQFEKERVAQEEYDAKVKFFALSFVEYLSGPEMLLSMFEKDPDGSLLLKVGGELNTFYEVLVTLLSLPQQICVRGRSAAIAFTWRCPALHKDKLGIVRDFTS